MDGFIAGLEAKLAEAKLRHDETTAAAKSISYSAHISGGEDRKKLDKLGADAAKQATEIVGLEAAIATAKSHVAAAEAADVDEAEREKARTALGLLDDFSKRGDALDSALTRFVREYEELSADFRQLEAIGFAPTSFALVRINMAAAVTTRLQFTDLRQAFLAPDKRRSFGDTIEGWSRNIRAKATSRLNRNAATKAARKDL
jgi:hypothetical protein